jgi:hypothetical protein
LGRNKVRIWKKSNLTEFRHEQYLKSAEYAFIVVYNKYVSFLILHVLDINLSTP